MERAYQEIKRRILGNAFRPSQQILEQELAEQLDMSRTPVREAVIRLEKEGLVEILPRRGMRVLPISPDDMRDIYEILTALEPRAAQRLAERRPGRDELVPLLTALTEMEAALEGGDLEAWAAGDERFHRCLLELCGNRRLAAMALAVFDQVHRARMVTLHMRPVPRESNLDHRRLIEAILAGDGAAAYAIHRDHRQSAMIMLTRILERHELSEL